MCADIPKMFVFLPKLDYLHVSIKIWRICPRTKSKNGAQNNSVYIPIEDYTNRYWEFLRIGLYAKNPHLC